MFNARAETVETKPSFRSAFRKRRCLIAADGFYEWKAEGRKKVPAYFHLRSGRPFGFAGLYETWRGPDQTEIHSCTIITTEPNALIRPIHDRMPVIVPGDRQHVWLDGRIEDPKTLLPILAPYPAEAMDFKWGAGACFRIKTARRISPRQTRDTALKSYRICPPGPFLFASTDHLKEPFAMPVIVIFLSRSRVENAGITLPPDWQVRYLTAAGEAEIVDAFRDADCILSLGSEGEIGGGPHGRLPEPEIHPVFRLRLQPGGRGGGRTKGNRRRQCTRSECRDGCRIHDRLHHRPPEAPRRIRRRGQGGPLRRLPAAGPQDGPAGDRRQPDRPCRFRLHRPGGGKDSLRPRGVRCVPYEAASACRRREGIRGIPPAPRRSPCRERHR